MASATTLVPAPVISEPFDYFANSWNVIGLKDYNNGTRITPQNELLLANGSKLQIRCGPGLQALSREQTKTLCQGWLPIILLQTEQAQVRYELSLWATPLPDAKNWKAAFDWPTESENFLNWIQAKATNLGRTRSEARIRLESTGTNALPSADWQKTLAPAEHATVCFRVPFAPLAAPALAGRLTAFDRESPELWLDRTIRYWRGVVGGAARITVPCEKSTQALLAAHVCQLIANDHGVLKGGEGFYDRFYIRDGAYQVLELEEAGLMDAARKALDPYLKAQRPDGRFESQKGQFDANGQALWVLWQFWKITGDDAWLRGVYPQMRRATEWVRAARKQTPQGAPFAGLLPNAVADGEHLWDGKHHIVGYDFWNLRGLLCTAEAARRLGDSREAQALESEAADYRTAIDAAWKRSGRDYFPPSWENAGTHWGNTETLWPTELFDRGDARVTASLKELRERHGGGFVEGTLRWTGFTHTNAIHPYLSSYTTMDSLIRGEHDQFVEDYYWYLLHSTAAHAFPEGIFYEKRFAWSHTIPHVTGAANFAFLLRHALIHEQDDELHLLLGAPDGWLEPGKHIRVEHAPTHFGLVNLRVDGAARGVEIKLDGPKRSAPARIVLHLPQSRPATRLPKNVRVVYRPDQVRRWDFQTVVELYQRQLATGK